MYSMITAFQQWAPLNGKTSTSLTDFIGWMNTYRNSLAETAPVAGNTANTSSNKQEKFDVLSNIMYAYLRGTNIPEIAEMNNKLDIFNPVRNNPYPANPTPVVTGVVPGSTGSYPTTLSGSTLLSSTLCTAGMQLIDNAALNTNQTGSSSLGTLNQLKG